MILLKTGILCPFLMFMGLKRQFAVYGFGENLYYFTVDGSKLYRIEADLSGVNYVCLSTVPK
jgi:hypothetical protein